MQNDEKDLEEGRMPLIEHLIELRSRLLRCAIWVGGAFLVCYYFKEQIYAFLSHPLAVALEGRPEHKMIYTGLTEAFFTYLKVSLWAAICLAFPYIAIQIWRFVAPGLYKNERRAFLPYLFATPVLFIIGASLVYFVVIPLAWRFFLSFETPGSTGQPHPWEAILAAPSSRARERSRLTLLTSVDTPRMSTRSFP